MKKNLIFFAFLTAIVACQKNDFPKEISQSNPSGEIVFNLAGEDLGLDVTTKATAVTSVSAVYWQINTGSSVTYNHSTSTSAVSSGTVSTGYYWPKDQVTYTFYVSNAKYTASSHSIAASNGTDVVCGTATGTGKNGSPASVSVTLDHIFARTGNVTYKAPSGFTCSGVSYKIASSGSKSGTAGTYTIGSGWGATASTALASQELTSSSDLYVIPGTYTITCTYTITNGLGYTETFTKSADVTLEQGKVNAITANIPAPSVSQITFSASVTAWGNANVSVNLPA